MRDYRTGPLRELRDVVLDSALLVESFGIWEEHGETGRKARDIHSACKKYVNERAWMPQKVGYDILEEIFKSIVLVASTSEPRGVRE